MALPGIYFRKGAGRSVLLFLAVLVAGSPRISRGDESAELDHVNTHFDNIEIVDPALSEKIIIKRVGSDRPHGGLLSVFAGFKNITDMTVKIEVQTLYKDDIGEPLGDGRASWIGMQLPPHSETMYRSASISGAAADFLIRVRLDKSG